MSKSWVDTWKKRLLGVPFNDVQVLQGLSRAPHHPLPRLDQQVVDRVLEIRDDPPEGLGRTPGPKAILYYLGRDESLKEQGVRLPKSTRTIHRLLRENRRIASRLPRLTDPIERPKPMEDWQLDFKVGTGESSVGVTCACASLVRVLLQAEDAVLALRV